MTDVLDRLETEPIPTTDVSADIRADDLRPRITLAAVAVGAAAIHLAMVPAHVGDWALQGWAFLATAWIQLGIAFLAVTRPSRRMWLATIVLNSAFVGAWAVSRTSGFPFGPQKGVVESMNIVDITCVLLELTLVVGALGMVALPRSLRSSRSRFFAPIIPIAVLGLTTGVLASPSATNHTHSADDRAHGGLVIPASMTEKGFGTFMNGHAHAHVEVALDPATQKELDRQLDITRDVAKQFPTMQDALDAGYERVGPYVPGLGTHLINLKGGAAYFNADGVVDDEDLRHPLSIMYANEATDAEITGFMYYAATPTEPAGFPGRNDGWHFHENLCGVAGPNGLDFPFGPDFGATKAQCDGVHGNLIDSQWMVHVWTVPGYDDMAAYGGVFAEMNPQLACSDGTWFSIAFAEWGAHPLNTCRSGAAGHPDL